MVSVNQLHFTSILEQGQNCLYGLGNRLCGYNPHSPPINFSLGEAIAAIGLIFAVYQLASPIWKITLDIKERLRYLPLIFITVGLISIFMASFITQINFLNPPFSYSVFWEHIGFIAFILSPLSLLIIANGSKNMFNKRRAKRFYHILIQKASTGKQEELEAVITIVRNNLEKLTSAISTIEYKFKNELTKEDLHAVYAKSLLNLILSEKPIADYIVTYRIDFLFNFIDFIKEKKLTGNTVGLGFQKLMKRLFQNPNSYLYKQLDYQGVTLYAPIYDTLFEDLRFVQEFSVLEMWFEFGVDKDIQEREDYIKVFIQAINKAIKANKFSDNSISTKIANAFNDLDDYILHILWFNKTSKEKLQSIMTQLEFFLGDNFPDAYSDAVENKTISNEEINSKKTKRLYDQSLSTRYCKTLAEFLGRIANIEDRDMERHWAMSATDKILPINDDNGMFDNLRKIFLEYLWEKIEDNVKDGLFPAVLRIYIQLMYWNNPDMPQWRKDERKKLIKYLNKELKPRLIKNELMANYKDKKATQLLPNDLVFMKNTKKFYIKRNDGSKQEFK